MQPPDASRPAKRRRFVLNMGMGGMVGDVKVLDVLPIEAGAFYVMDRGYLDYERLYKVHQAGAYSLPVPSGA